MGGPSSDPRRFVQAISAAGLSIYDPIEVGDLALWIPSRELEALLDAGLRGLSVAGLPLRTRSKIVKERVCQVLGYPIPAGFRRVRPRFPGQCFDTYVQKSNNLQVWNEELTPTRRYVLIGLSADSVVTKVKVVQGDALAALDATGTLTQKYQARCLPGPQFLELVTSRDTSNLRPLVSRQAAVGSKRSPVDYPVAGELLPIAVIFKALGQVVGLRCRAAGMDQERGRGSELHARACRALGYMQYQDDGRFPDVRHQLLEVKFQSSPTIDLGLVRPDSTDALDLPRIGGRRLRHRDVRYAVFYGERSGAEVEVTHLILTTGERFYSRFRQFGGKVLNKKLQIPLPADFFDR